jgi:hypothetical protein
MSKTRITPPSPSLAPHQQAQAATLIRSVRERLLAEDPDIAADLDLWRDTFDGESDAIDLIRNLIRASIDADPLARGHAQAPGRDHRPRRTRRAT